MSSYKKGSVSVGPVNTVDHLPECMMIAALEFQDFIRGSKLDVYNPESHEGCFRQLTVRVANANDVMMMVALSKRVK